VIITKKEPFLEKEIQKLGEEFETYIKIKKKTAERVEEIFRKKQKRGILAKIRAIWHNDLITIEDVKKDIRHFTESVRINRYLFMLREYPDLLDDRTKRFIKKAYYLADEDVQKRIVEAKLADYDMLTGLYNRGFFVKKLDEVIQKRQESLKYKEEHELEKYEYDREKIKSFADFILTHIHYNMKHLRIDLSPHPFSTYIGKGDHRITMRPKDNFAKTYSSTMHEYGHALYDIQTHEDLHYSPIGGGTSLVIHESQSRFWENFIGKSKTFLASIYEEMKRINPEIEKYSVDDIYHYINLVKPSPIRTEADEVTYHMHIIIRFELEKAMIEGKIKVSELPRIWRDKYQEYLGISPKTDKEGVLQDIHWSQGSIGYFPTYSMGTALSALWKKHIEKELGKIEDLVKTKEGIRKIQDWLKEKIHQHGSAYLYNELLQKSTGENFSAQALLDYLEEKYKTIY